MSELLRCPFVRAVAEGRELEARALAAAPPEPAEPAVVDWLVAEARRQLEADLEDDDAYFGPTPV